MVDISAHIKEAEKYRSIIEPFASSIGVQSSLIAGIGSRESGWGLLLTPPGPEGTGDFTPRGGHMPPDGLGWGRGLMQLDYEWQPIAKDGKWRDPSTNIERACMILGASIRTFRGMLYEDPIRAGIAAYNCGISNTQRAHILSVDIDHFTSGKDYSRDVLRRQAQFKQSGWE